LKSVGVDESVEGELELSLELAAVLLLADAAELLDDGSEAGLLGLGLGLALGGDKRICVIIEIPSGSYRCLRLADALQQFADSNNFVRLLEFL
jgi:hypothetical protein